MCSELNSGVFAQRAFRYACGALLLFIWGNISLLSEVSNEYQLKAVFLWRLGQFTEFPAEAFEKPDSPLIIGVIGKNPFENLLEAAVEGETAHGRKVQVRYYRQVSEIERCHVLYVNEADARRTSEVLAAVAKRSILTAGDSEAFARAGGMVRFLADKGRLKLRVNVSAMAAAHLTLDARVLRAAEVVGEK
jgi:hypothetical protein